MALTFSFHLNKLYIFLSSGNSSLDLKKLLFKKREHPRVLLLPRDPLPYYLNLISLCKESETRILIGVSADVGDTNYTSKANQISHVTSRVVEILSLSIHTQRPNLSTSMGWPSQTRIHFLHFIVIKMRWNNPKSRNPISNFAIPPLYPVIAEQASDILTAQLSVYALDAIFQET